jgi:RNA polymerase II subunit A C-terminal domain phosphatase SSU72
MSVKMRFAVVCSSNMNRSMEAHAFLQKKGYDIHSYGTGDKIKIPGNYKAGPP